MSNTDVWTVDSAVYEYAKQTAKARTSAQWAKWMINPDSVNLWTTYNSAQNANWEDAWFEKELGGFFNGPSVNGSPAYEVTQNAYYMYCWFKNHGYSERQILTYLTVCWNECRMGMGSWEGNLAPYSFSNNPASLIGFTASSIAESGTHYNNNWYSNGSIVPASPNATFMDEETHITYSLPRPAGSWESFQGWGIRTYTDPDTGFEKAYLVNGQPVFLESPNKYCVIGYGIVQWTNWTRLVRHANICVPTYGGQNWQFNATLQLMTLETERSIAMNTDATGQSSPSYEGEWVNANATSAFFTYNGVNYHYPTSCTWDNWATGGYNTWVESKCADLGITDANTINSFKQLMSFDILGRCYLHSSHYNTNYSALNTQIVYFAGAIAYWNANGGADIRDVPRPRDIPTCELDKYHVSQGNMIALLSSDNNRRCKRVRTILL